MRLRNDMGRRMRGIPVSVRNMGMIRKEGGVYAGNSRSLPASSPPSMYWWTMSRHSL
jgi:hypothetical protein